MFAGKHVEYSTYAFPRVAMTVFWIYPVRVFQAIIALVVFGLSAYGMSLLVPPLACRTKMVLTSEARAVMLTLRFDYIIILMFSNGIWSAFLATPVLALQMELPRRTVHRIVILAVEWTTMILWFVCFFALATISPPNHCDIHSCIAPRMILFFGAIEWYAMLTPTRLDTLPAQLKPQLLIPRFLGYYSWLPQSIASQLPYRFAVGLGVKVTPLRWLADNQESGKCLKRHRTFLSIPQYTPLSATPQSQPLHIGQFKSTTGET